MQQKFAAKTSFAWAVLGVVVLALAVPNMAQAKRLGGGGSAGRSASFAKPMPPANKQAFGQNTQSQAANPQAAAASPSAAAKAPAPAAAQAAKRNWLGPVMGIAAGLGLAALFSSMGLGAGLAQVFSMLLLVAGAVFVGVVLLRLLRGARPQGLAYQGAGNHGLQIPPTPPVYQHAQAEPFGRVASGFEGQGGSQTVVSLPEGFDTFAFLNNAKQFFVTLQGLNDAENWSELRRYCSEDLWQHFVDEAKLRPAGQAQRTEIMKLEAHLLGVENEGQDQVAAVSYVALVREDETSLPHDIQEVWTLVRPQDASSGWVLAGIHVA